MNKIVIRRATDTTAVATKTIKEVIVGDHVMVLVCRLVKSMDQDGRDDLSCLLTAIGPEDYAVYSAIVNRTHDLVSTFSVLVIENGLDLDKVTEKKISAIQLLRTETSCGLKEGKEAVELWIDQTLRTNY